MLGHDRNYDIQACLGLHDMTAINQAYTSSAGDPSRALRGNPDARRCGSLTD